MPIPRQIGFAFCLLAVTLAPSERPRTSYDPAQQHPPAKHDSLIDFMLNRINPTDKDYGQRIEQTRKNAIEAGFDSLPGMLLVALLIVSFAVIMHQDLERRHREFIASRFLAWYHNELVHARATAKEAITRNLQLKTIIDEDDEAGLGLKTAQPRSKSGPFVGGNSASGPPSAVPKTTPVAGHDLVMEINKLREKVAAQEDTEKTLRHQISQLDRRLQDEKQRNRALKGE